MAKNLIQWNPEDEQFWNTTGKDIAARNLYISIGSLICGFAVWGYWAIITVQMLNLGFPFTQAELFTLAAISGLSGATLRIPNAFLIRIAGGRNTLFLTTLLLIIPAFGTGLALQSHQTPLWVYQALALLSGIGGGNFASSMSNISFFFPKRKQGVALGLNAGLGNFGITVMQVVIPLAMTTAFFGGESMILKNASGWIFGKIPEGAQTWIHNASYVWLVFLVPLSFATWFGMNNILAPHVSPNLKSTFAAFTKILMMLLIGLVISGFGFILMQTPIYGVRLNKWVVITLITVVTLLALRFAPGGSEYRQNLTRQYQIFKNKHTWIMTALYTMTFGSFIGFSAAMALSIQVIFGFKHVLVDGVMTHTTVNPHGPSAFMYAWLCPFIGALTRPVGGWLADKIGGTLVTQVVSFIMVLSVLGAAHYMHLAYQSATPEVYFQPFLLLFLLYFFATGLGNGSIFRTAAAIFDKEQAGPVLGWMSAIAAYGAFIIPQVIGEEIKNATPEYALYGFAAFYVLCILINWWFYLRRSAGIFNP